MLESVREETRQTRAYEQEIRRFGEIVTAEPAIQERLQAAVEGGIDRAGFVGLYVSLAAESGIRFDPEQMNIAMQEQKQGRDKILPSVVQKLAALV